jgi:hypothetical protein
VDRLVSSDRRYLELCRVLVELNNGHQPHRSLKLRPPDPRRPTHGPLIGEGVRHIAESLAHEERTIMLPEPRSAFQAAMQHKFIAAIERRSGRTVLTVISNHHRRPRRGNRVFVLKSPGNLERGDAWGSS